MKGVQTGLVGGALIALAVGLVMNTTPGAVLIGALIAAALICLAAITSDTRIGIALTAFAAAGANTYLFVHKLAAAGTPSVCSVGEILNCDKINASAYSEIMGFPITLFGLAFYLGLGFAALSKRESVPHLFRVTVLFMIPSLAYSLFLAYISKTIGAVCLFCLSLYVANIWLTIAGFKGLKEQGGKLSDDLMTALTGRATSTVTGVFAVVALIGASVWSGRDQSGGTPVVPVADVTTGEIPLDALAPLYQEDDVGTVALDGTEPILGDPDAPYMVIEFADFACPHCAHAGPELAALVQMHPEVQVRFKAYPLSGPCEEAVVDGVLTDDRCRGAQAAECAHQQGKFWEYSHAVFKNLGYLSASDLHFQADHLGLDMAAFQACMADGVSLQGVIADANAGRAAGVTSTPSMFLRGLRPTTVLLAANIDAIEVLIEAKASGRALPHGTAAPRE